MHKIKNIPNPLEKSAAYSLGLYRSLYYIESSISEFIQKINRNHKEVPIINAFKIQQNNAHCKDL